MGSLSKWVQRAFFAVVVVWLSWLSLAIAGLNDQVDSKQSETMNLMVSYQQQVNSLQEQIQVLRGEEVSTPEWVQKYYEETTEMR